MTRARPTWRSSRSQRGGDGASDAVLHPNKSEQYQQSSFLESLQVVLLPTGGSGLGFTGRTYSESLEETLREVLMDLGGEGSLMVLKEVALAGWWKQYWSERHSARGLPVLFFSCSFFSWLLFLAACLSLTMQYFSPQPPSFCEDFTSFTPSRLRLPLVLSFSSLLRGARGGDLVGLARSACRLGGWACSCRSLHTTSGLTFSLYSDSTWCLRRSLRAISASSCDLTSGRAGRGRAWVTARRKSRMRRGISQQRGKRAGRARGEARAVAQLGWWERQLGWWERWRWWCCAACWQVWQYLASYCGLSQRQCRRARVQRARLPAPFDSPTDVLQRVVTCSPLCFITPNTKQRTPIQINHLHHHPPPNKQFQYNGPTPPRFLPHAALLRDPPPPPLAAGIPTYRQQLASTLQETIHHVQQRLSEGSLLIPTGEGEAKQVMLSQLLKKREINPFQSNYRGFLLNSDREKSQQRYEIFKKIREEYSKEKTAVVVKDVENKIKQWTAKKLDIEKRRKKSVDKQHQIELEMLEHIRRQELERREAEKEAKKEEVQMRLRAMEEKREKRNELMKESSIRSLDIKSPKYKLLEEQFSQVEERIKEEQEKILEEKRQAMRVKKEELLEHSKKYAEIKKQKEEERKHKVKVTVKEDKSPREEFNIFTLENKEQKEEDDKKRKRRKEFNQKIKSLRVKSKDKSIENEEKLQNSKATDRLDEPDGKSPRRRKHIIDASADGRKLGNDYLQQLKEKDISLLNKSAKLPKLTSSSSLPSIAPYKNYLTQIRIKRKPVGDEIEQLKRNCRSKAEIYEELHKKSSAYEETMLKKINELKKMNRYDDSVMKESEIDELYTRYIKTRLACIEV